MSEWIDITVPLFNGMVGWPGDPLFHIELVEDMKQGAECNLSALSTCVHIGTHMDAPLHFIEGGASIDEAPLDVLIGPARVIALEDIETAGIQPGERILFRTKNSDTSWIDQEFQEDFTAISEAAASYLASVKPALIGIDYLSIGAYANPTPAHKAILGAGIWVIEGLDLTKVPPGNYDLICLPLKLQGSEGAPARATLRVRH